jgi:hypothetical protein
MAGRPRQTVILPMPFFENDRVFDARHTRWGRRTGGANIWRATAPVTFWGALAMALTAGIGKLFVSVV